MRRIIFRLIFIFALLIQSIVSAADYKSVDWNNAPRISNKAEFFNLYQNYESHLQSTMPVIFQNNAAFVNVQDFLNLIKNVQYVNITYGKFNNGTAWAIYEMTFYPGVKVLHAYKTGDTSILAPEEKKLYNIAVGIVRKVNRQPTTLMKELFIHEEITERVSYYNTKITEKTPRYCNAIGALIDGKANCQGYTDSFYMLGRMCGLNVGKMLGRANNQEHVWNTITFGDGRIYAVDVTWDDASFAFADSGEYTNYIYFNAPLKILQTTHSWNDSNYNQQLYSGFDGRYFYYTPEFFSSNGKYFAFHSNSAEEALGYIAQRIARDGWRLSWGMAPYDSKYADAKFSLNRLLHEILPQRYRWYGTIKMNVARRGDYLYYTVDAKKN